MTVICHAPYGLLLGKLKTVVAFLLLRILQFKLDLIGLLMF